MNNYKKICYICESTKTSIYKRINGFTVYRCKKCDLKWVDGIGTDDIVSFYDEGYFNNDSKTGYKNYLADEGNHRRLARNILYIVDRIRDLNKARILDVGCALGFLLDEARRSKYCDVCGVELSRYAYEYAKNELGLNVINSELKSSHLDSDSFDAVFMIGTLEHLISPKDTIAIINRILKRDGLLVLTTLDTAGLFPLYSIKPPEHLFYFNHNNLLFLLNNLGFEISLRRTHFAYYYLHDLFHRLSEFLSLSFLSSISRMIRERIPNVYIKIPTNEVILVAKKVAIL